MFRKQTRIFDDCKEDCQKIKYDSETVYRKRNERETQENTWRKQYANYKSR